jgi:hypothetical protein
MSGRKAVRARPSGIASARVPRPLVAALATLVLVVPAVLSQASGPDSGLRVNSNSKVIHHHTDVYSVYNPLDNFYGNDGINWYTSTDNARQDWDNLLTKLKLPNVGATETTVYGLDDRPEIELAKDNRGSNNAKVIFSAPYHDPHTTVTFNTFYSFTSSEIRGRTCNAIGNIMSLADAAGPRHDCMQSPTQYNSPGTESAGMLDDWYGPQVTPFASLGADARQLYDQRDVLQVVRDFSTNPSTATGPTLTFDPEVTGHAIKSIEIKIEASPSLANPTASGVIRDTTQTFAPCAEWCARHYQISVDTSTLADGEYTVTVIGKNEWNDSNKAVGSRSFTLKVNEPYFGYHDQFQQTADEPADPITVSQQGGANVDRLTIPWARIEKDADPGPNCQKPTTYDWSPVQSAYDRMVARGIHPILLVTTSPCWTYTPVSCPEQIDYCPPKKAFDGDWQAFVQAAVQRFPFALGVEVWNEPNLSQFWGRLAPNATRYADLFNAAYTGAKAANPNIPVVSGGLSSADDWPAYLSSFLGHINLSNDGSLKLDAVGLHPYTKGADVDQPTQTVDYAQAAASKVATAQGLAGKPVWVTESGGLALDPNGTDVTHYVPNENSQATHLGEIYDAIRDAGAPVAILYRFADDRPPTTSDWGNSSGVTTWESNQGVLDLVKRKAWCVLAQRRGYQAGVTC